MNYFSNIFGLITKNDPTTENGGLFFAHYLVLKTMNRLAISYGDEFIYRDKMNLSFVESGLYLRSHHHKNRTVSQDEMSGFIVASFLLKTHHRFAIWKYLFFHFGCYPATGKIKFYNLASYYAWAVMSLSMISFLFAPFYAINLLISSNKSKQDTSSKLIYLSELFVMKDLSKISLMFWKYYKWRMEKMYGMFWIEELFKIYFHNEDQDFPLLILSKGLICHL